MGKSIIGQNVIYLALNTLFSKIPSICFECKFTPIVATCNKK